MTLSPAVIEKSRELAELLGQQAIRREGNAFFVPSRTKANVSYRVDLCADGALLCGCPGFTFRQECWHTRAVREELSMTTETAVAIRPVHLEPSKELVPSEHTLTLIEKTARLALSGAIALPKELNTPEKVGAVMLYGLELGLKPMSALRHVFIINGRPQPSAEVMAGLLLSNEPDARIEVVELNETKCTLRLVRPSRNVNETYTVTWDEIKKAGLDKDIALKYPKDRLRWHCTKRLLRIYAPDAINGLEGAALSQGFLSQPQEADLDDSDLYNEGDEREYIDGQVIDRETGEIMDTPPVAEDEPAAQPEPASDEDVARLNELMTQVFTAMQEKGQAGEYAGVLKDLKQMAPETNQQGAVKAKNITAEHAPPAIAYLEGLLAAAS